MKHKNLIFASIQSIKMRYTPFGFEHKGMKLPQTANSAISDVQSRSKSLSKNTTEKFHKEIQQNKNYGILVLVVYPKIGRPSLWQHLHSSARLAND